MVCSVHLNKALNWCDIHVCNHRRPKNVCERQRIVYIYNMMYIIYVNNTLPLAHEISRHFWAAYGVTTVYNYAIFIKNKFEVIKINFVVHFSFHNFIHLVKFY